MRIYKYKLDVGYNELHLPRGAKILSACSQKDDIVVYVQLDPDASLHCAVNVVSVSTGYNMDAYADWHFLNTVSLEGGDLMFHVFCNRKET